MSRFLHIQCLESQSAEDEVVISTLQSMNPVTTRTIGLHSRRLQRCTFQRSLRVTTWEGEPNGARCPFRRRDVQTEGIVVERPLGRELA